MKEEECKNCNSCKDVDTNSDVQKRRQIQVQHNSGGFLVTITSDYEKENIDFISKKVIELVEVLDKRD